MGTRTKRTRLPRRLARETVDILSGEATRRALLERLHDERPRTISAREPGVSERPKVGKRFGDTDARVERARTFRLRQDIAKSQRESQRRRRARRRR